MFKLDNVLPVCDVFVFTSKMRQPKWIWKCGINYEN